jgi:hypothetical protein
MVAWKRLIITLYIHCLSCLLLRYTYIVCPVYYYVIRTLSSCLLLRYTYIVCPVYYYVIRTLSVLFIITLYVHCPLYYYVIRTLSVLFIITLYVHCLSCLLFSPEMKELGTRTNHRNLFVALTSLIRSDWFMTCSSVDLPYTDDISGLTYSYFLFNVPVSTKIFATNSLLLWTQKQHVTEKVWYQPKGWDGFIFQKPVSEICECLQVCPPQHKKFCIS